MQGAVVFDLDGVIFDSERIVRQGWQYAGKKLGLTADLDPLFLQCVGTNHSDTEQLLQRQFGSKFSYETFRKYTREYFFGYTKQRGLPVKRGALELLETLRTWQYQIGLASSSTLRYIQQELRNAELIDYFDVIVSGEGLAHSKPAPDIYLMACAKLQVPPMRAYAIEDSYNGVRSANQAGMWPIMVPDLLPPTAEMRRLSVSVCSDLFAVRDFLAAEWRV